MAHSEAPNDAWSHHVSLLGEGGALNLFEPIKLTIWFLEK